jgi:hypothetical protein
MELTTARPLTAREAAQVLGITPRAVLYRLAGGALRGWRLPIGWLVDPISVESLRETLAQKSRPGPRPRSNSTTTSTR